MPKLKVSNPTTRHIYREPVSIGIPCPKGKIRPGETFSLEGNTTSIPVQTHPLTYWPDKSIKWLLCDFIVDIPPSNQINLQLQHIKIHSTPSIHVKETTNTIEVDTGAALFILDTSTLLPFKQVRINNQNILAQCGGSLWLKDQDNQKHIAQIDHIKKETCGPIRLTYKITGHFTPNTKLLFSARIHFHTGTSKTSIELTIHNPTSAVHPGGIWDLGDNASFFINELVLSLPWSDLDNPRRLHYKLSPDGQWHTHNENTSIEIYQESSGGENWNSPNHRNKDGRVPMSIDGFQVKQESHIITKGKRSQPTVWLESKTNYGSSIVVPKFWQEFPKSLKITACAINISLFPRNFPSPHELQGGEQKTQSIYFDFSTDKSHSGWGDNQLEITIDPQTINDSRAIKNIICGQPVAPSYQLFLNAALNGENSFFSKREIIDEFGWRNFGDIYADHEAHFHKGQEPLVSHYNNQYDLLDSFYREYLRTGNYKWAELAKDLAQHIIDIDINHTNSDRDEYNKGLFWHTDHYLDAGLSTHRMVSKEHLLNKNKSLCGGGPSPEHCYTSGLKMHYLISGNPQYKKTILEIAEWSYLAISKPQTILAAILRSKQLIGNFKNKNPNVLSKFPFTRGTGNCLNAQLDAFELTGTHKYLKNSAQLIKETIHPKDNIENRDLLNAEKSWSYTVFLTYLVKFLSVKELQNEQDIDYNYAKDSLLHYAKWMAQNEYSYLEKPEQLEYPNETWAAQDLRKSVIFQAAAHYITSTTDKHQLLEKHILFKENSFIELTKHKTSFYTRPLALILQNGGMIQAQTTKHFARASDNDLNWNNSPHNFTLNNVITRVIKDFKSCTLNTNVRKELKWLKTRIN